MVLMSFAFVSIGMQGLFQEWSKLVVDTIGFLDSGFYFPVQFSIFCEYAAKLFEFFDLFQLGIVDTDVKISCCSTDLHSFCLADADFHIVVLTSSIQVGSCSSVISSFIRLWSSANSSSYRGSGSGFASFVMISMQTMKRSGERTHPSHSRCYFKPAGQSFGCTK